LRIFKIILCGNFVEGAKKYTAKLKILSHDGVMVSKQGAVSYINHNCLNDESHSIKENAHIGAMHPPVLKTSYPFTERRANTTGLECGKEAFVGFNSCAILSITLVQHFTRRPCYGPEMRTADYCNGRLVPKW
jgi:hypothetical protein